MSNHKIALITDSTSDMLDDVANQYDITVVPQIIIWGTDELKDGIDITPERFYKRLEEDAVHPSTSQPTPKDFITIYDEAVEKGAEELVVITLSHKLSGTYESARQAAEDVDYPVHLLDSHSVSWGLAWQVVAAARAREEGADAEGMLAAANRVRETVKLYLSLDTLEYLHKGGRIGGAAKLIGTALNLKPMLMVDHEQGIIDAVERTRTRSKAIGRMYDVFKEEMDPTKTLRITVLHGAEPDLAKEMAEKIQKELDPDEMYITQVAPVIGVHTGPGALALCGYYEVE